MISIAPPAALPIMAPDYTITANPKG